MKDITKKTLVLGGSINPNRYSNMAIRLLRANNIPVVSIGLRKGQVEDVSIVTEHIIMDDIHTVTIYMNPTVQDSYYDYILALKPKRIIFNPGTENPVLKAEAKSLGIEIVENCTLVMLRNNLF